MEANNATDLSSKEGLSTNKKKRNCFMGIGRAVERRRVGGGEETMDLPAVVRETRRAQ